MSRPGKIIVSLKDLPVTIAAAERVGMRINPGAGFRARLLLANEGNMSLHWSAEQPLRLAYRWFDESGTCVEADGHRSLVPMPLEPEATVEIELSASAPATVGKYRMIASLVLEGVHWACDVAKNGWLALDMEVVAPPAWPEELELSPGGKALRGAIAAASLERMLAERPIDPAVVNKPARSPAPSLMEGSVQASPMSLNRRLSNLGRRMRAWLRHMLGVVEMRQAVEELLRRSAEQERQMLAARKELAETVQARAEQALQFEAMQARHAAWEAHWAKLDQIHADVASLADRHGLAFDHVHRALNDVAAAHNELHRKVGKEITAAHDELHQKMGKKIIAAHDELDRKLGKEIASVRQELGQELRGGTVAVELLSTLRQLADWARSAGDLGAIATIDQQIRSLPDRMAAEAARQLPVLGELERHAAYNSAKLDALLSREMIALPTAGLVLARNRHGFLAIQDDDVAAIAYYSSGDLPEPGTVALVERLLQPGDCFIDVGANVGAYTLVAARHVGPSGKVIAVEPMPATARALRTTVSLNGVSSIVETHECALGSAAGRATMYPGKTSGHSSMLEIDGAGGEPVEVDVKRGSEIVGRRRPQLIKVDVEGWELDVLEGLNSCIRSAGVSLIVECSPVHIRRKGLSLEAWLNWLRGLGMKIWIIDDRRIALRPLLDPSEVGDGSANLFLSRACPAALEAMVDES